MKNSNWLPILLLILVIALFTPIPAYADVAPPEQPPGTNIVPGTVPTQVRMVAETVTLNVLSKPAPEYPCQADTEAVFTMRNLGTQTETMQARFPLTFWNNESDGFGKFPEIPNIQIFVDGKKVSTQRIDADFTNPGGGVAHQQAPWAAFDVVFPPGKDVTITVKYTTNGFGYLETGDCSMRYILETGAGWNSTIGSADIIVKLPYPSSDENIRLGDQYFTSDGAKLDDNDIHWHLEDFEPTDANNIIVTVTNTVKWQNVLKWREQTGKTPNDGEAWGQLGKAIKESIAGSKGFPHNDAGAQKLYAEARQAYEKAVTILPKDALWHYGFADLLWGHYSSSPDYGQSNDDIVNMANELRISLALNPNNQNVRDMAEWVSQDFPWAISKTENGFDYPVLTATPTIDPLSIITPLPEATSTLQAQPQPTETPHPSTVTDIPVSPTKSSGPGLPVCGGAGLVMLPALAGFWLTRQRRK